MIRNCDTSCLAWSHHAMLVIFMDVMRMSRHPGISVTRRVTCHVSIEPTLINHFLSHLKQSLFIINVKGFTPCYHPCWPHGPDLWTNHAWDAWPEADHWPIRDRTEAGADQSEAGEQVGMVSGCCLRHGWPEPMMTRVHSKHCVRHNIQWPAAAPDTLHYNSPQWDVTPESQSHDLFGKYLK